MRPILRGIKDATEIGDGGTVLITPEGWGGDITPEDIPEGIYPEGDA